MKRRTFLRNTAVATGAAVMAGATKLSASSIPATEKNFYELREYQLTGSGAVNQLAGYYENAVIPFLSARGAKVGVFQDYGMEEPPKVYVLHAFQTPEDYLSATMAMKTDSSFLEAGADFLKRPADQPVYERYTTFLATAFDGMPEVNVPDANRGLLELRIYESYSQDAAQRKIDMFNNEEIALFEKVGLNTVFFGSLLAGPYMPALAYMVSFTDMEDRDATWARFGGSEEWAAMRTKEIYANAMNKIRRKFLVPMEFSQI